MPDLDEERSTCEAAPKGRGANCLGFVGKLSIFVLLSSDIAIPCATNLILTGKFNYLEVTVTDISSSTCQAKPRKITHGHMVG